MITNGTLLDRHETSVFVANGLNALMLSIDSPDPEVTARVRLGTDLVKTLANVKQFRKQFPNVELRFSSVVSSATIGQVFDLVRLGQDLGVSMIFFKEVSDVVGASALPPPASSDWLRRARDPRYFEAMPRLLLQPGQFQQMQSEVTARWPSGSFRFLSSEFQTHRRASVTWQANSLPKAAPRQESGASGPFEPSRSVSN
jgi:sulfatase maturation enzyme AslB (radical SAM superfamily)